MSDYKKLVALALAKSQTVKLKRRINESILYPDGMTERMNPKLEEDLRLQKHSLGKHPALPEGD